MINDLVFIKTLQFLNQSLSNLMNNLPDESFIPLFKGMIERANKV